MTATPPAPRAVAASRAGWPAVTTATGTPDEGELQDAMATGLHEPEAEEEEAYAGPAGREGGTPAGKRGRGGRTHKGLRPGGVHRGDSTLGSSPRLGAE